MEPRKPLKVQFKLENQVDEDLIEINWTIGKIKGKIRKLFEINLYYTLEFIYKGQILDNSKQFREIGYKRDTIIKVMATRASEF
jgi:hypothetical protein